MVENKDIGQSKSNKIVFVYRIVVSIIMVVSIILVYILNHLGQSKEVDAMFNSTQNNLLEGIIEGNTYDNTIATEHATSEESLKKLSDWRLMLVNYENEMPKDYVPPLSSIDEARQFDSRAIDSLVQMMLDMNAVGINHIWAQSTYRDPEKQKHLIEESIQEYLEQGKSMEEAEALTARSIGEPYKSEHNLGLAVDFNDVNYAFENEKAFTWLMENAENYGFILRYPADKEEITKIKYEPWHWRYVGPEYAKEMNDLGFCLEEYIEYLKNN
ncbi:MAG: M15 family metallopeptidase [Clostridia bacterium]|jgi:D-alanyl-D-alanine carboxypeptidase